MGSEGAAPGVPAGPNLRDAQGRPRDASFNRATASGAGAAHPAPREPAGAKLHSGPAARSPARGRCPLRPAGRPPGVPGRASPLLSSPRGSLNPAPRSIPAQTLTARPHLRKPPAGRSASGGPALHPHVGCSGARSPCSGARVSRHRGRRGLRRRPAGGRGCYQAVCVRGGDGGGGCVREGPPEVRVPPGQSRGADAAHAAR